MSQKQGPGKPAPAKGTQKTAKSTTKQAAKKMPAREEKPTLLAGGNPQIAKGDGDAPVQNYIAAMPGWKRDVGQRLDALIVRAIPGVCKAIKWNTPFYGIEDQGWFLGFHCITKYIKVAFFRGTSLRPVPPVESKQKSVRYFHIHEDDQLDEAQFVAWVKQASLLPGERMSGSKQEPERDSQLSEASSEEVSDWRVVMLDRIRMLIKQADLEVIEEVKWRKPSNAMRGVRVWSHAGIICTGETYKNVVKLTFANGASLDDPSRLFNSSLEGNTRRAIDCHEGDKVDEKALKALIHEAVALNVSAKEITRPARSQKKPKSA